jgi:hypothetical protein
MDPPKQIRDRDDHPHGEHFLDSRATPLPPRSDEVLFNLNSHLSIKR